MALRTPTHDADRRSAGAVAHLRLSTLVAAIAAVAAVDAGRGEAPRPHQKNRRRAAGAALALALVAGGFGISKAMDDSSSPPSNPAASAIAPAIVEWSGVVGADRSRYSRPDRASRSVGGRHRDRTANERRSPPACRRVRGRHLRRWSRAHQCARRRSDRPDRSLHQQRRHPGQVERWQDAAGHGAGIVTRERHRTHSSARHVGAHARDAG